MQIFCFQPVADPGTGTTYLQTFCLSSSLRRALRRFQNCRDPLPDESQSLLISSESLSGWDRLFEHRAQPWAVIQREMHKNLHSLFPKARILVGLRPQFWLKKLHIAGFIRKRMNGGHARFCCGIVAVDVPIHQKELSRLVVSSLKRALQAAQVGGQP